MISSPAYRERKIVKPIFKNFIKKSFERNSQDEYRNLRKLGNKYIRKEERRPS